MRKTLTPDSRQQFLDGLPASLRAAVEGCTTFDLVPWIDRDNPPPRKPILSELEAYGARSTPTRRTSQEASLPGVLGDWGFFDVADLTAPRIQYAVWKLRRVSRHGVSSVHHCLLDLRSFLDWLFREERIMANPLSGVNLKGWAKLEDKLGPGGKLPDIGRIQQRVWLWLCQSEPSAGWNTGLIVDDWNQRSDGARKELDAVHWQALPIATDRERFASKNLVHTYIGRARAIRENPPGVNFRHPPCEHFGAGSHAAKKALFDWWKQRKQAQLGSSWRRARWNGFPRAVRIAIAGNNAKLLRDIPPGSRGRSVMNSRLRSKNKDCQGGDRCPRTIRWLALSDADNTPKTILALEDHRSTEERKAICPIHYRVPRNAETISGLVAGARAARDRSWKPSKLGTSPRQANENNNPETALHRLLGRSSRAFDLWCEERHSALQSYPKVLDEYLTLAEDTERQLFGKYVHRIKLRTHRTDANNRIRHAVWRARRERELENLVRRRCEQPETKAREEAGRLAGDTSTKPATVPTETPRKKCHRPRDTRRRAVYDFLIADHKPIDAKSFIAQFRIHFGRGIKDGTVKVPSVDAARRFLQRVRREARDTLS